MPHEETTKEGTGLLTCVRTIAGQPERGVPLLVLDVHVGSIAEDHVHKLGMTFVSCNGEGCVLGRGHWQGIHIRTLGEGGREERRGVSYAPMWMACFLSLSPPQAVSSQGPTDRLSLSTHVFH